MKILNVTVTDVVKIGNKEDIGSGNVNTVKCVFSLPESFNGLTPIASFKKNETIYNKAIVDNECYVPHEVLEETGYVYFGVYAYEQTEEGLVLRESPLLSGFTVDVGSYMGEGEDSLIIEPSDFEMYIAAMNKVKMEAQSIIDNFSAEDVVFEDGDTFQEKYEKGDLDGPTGIVMQPDEPTEDDVYIWVDTDDEGPVAEERYVSNMRLEGNTLYLDFNNGTFLSVDLSSLDGGGSGGESTTTLTEEQIQAINNMIATSGEELVIEYDDTVLAIDFALEGDNLVVTNNVKGVDFNINENEELEVIYNGD